MKQNNNGKIFILLAVTLLGAYLRLYRLDYESFRLDEGQTIWQASHSLEFIVNYSAQNVHLPLFNILVHFWMRAGFVTESSLRLLPAIFGILTLPVIYLLALRLFKDKRIALLALTLSSLSPYLVWYSREARPYSLLVLLTVISYLLLVSYISSGKRKYVIFLTIVNIVGMYTHYFFGLNILAQAVYIVVLLKAYRKGFVASAVAVGLALVPWINYYLQNKTGGDLSPALTKPESIQVIVAVFESVFGYQSGRVATPFIALWPLICFFGFLFLSKRKKIHNLQSVLLASSASIIPILTLLIVTYAYRPVFLSRYFIVSSPFLIFLFCWFVANLSRTTKRVLIVLSIALVVSLNYTQTFFHDVKQKEDYRTAMRYVNRVAGPRDLVLVSPIYTIYPAQYYYAGQARLTTLPLWDKRAGLSLPQTTPEIMAKDIDQLRPGHTRIFLVSTLNLTGGQESKNFLDKKYDRLEIHEFSEDIVLSVYKAEY